MELPHVSESTVNSVNEFVKTFLEKGEIQSIISAFQDSKYESFVQNHFPGLISVIMKCLKSDVTLKTSNKLTSYSDLINFIADKSEPEEVLFCLLDEFEEAENDNSFLVLLKPSQSALKRIPHKRMNSFGWCFSAVNKYLQKLPIPEDYDLVGEERLLLDCDDNFIRITSLYSEVIQFYYPFIEESRHMDHLENEYRSVLLKFLIDLLGKPLSHLDMDDSRNTVGKGRLVAGRIVSMIFEICIDPYIFIERQDDFQVNFEQPSKLSLAVLYYLIVKDQNYTKKVPKVYNPVYLFQNSLKFVTELLAQGNQFCVEKGLYLVDSLLQSVKNSDLSNLLLESTDHNKFCEHLSHVIVFNQIEALRKAAFAVFQTYLDSFDLCGKYLIIYNLVNSLNHTGLIGFIIVKFKDILASVMTNDKAHLPTHFKGEKLWSILSRFCYLPKKEESDLIELADQIIATLNFLRYLTIRDVENKTLFKDYIPCLQKEYLEPLKKGIILSRAHYELKVEELEENQTKNDKKESQVTVTVCGQDLQEMPNYEKIKLLKSSLAALDVIDCLLCRLNECIETTI